MLHNHELVQTAEFVPTSRDSRWCFGKINYADFVHALHLTMFQPAHIQTGKTTKAGTHEGNLMKQAANVKFIYFYQCRCS